MSVSGPEAANYAQDIRTDINDMRVRDRFDSSAGFDESIEQVTADYGTTLAEMDRNPAGIHDVFMSMDADEKLFRMAIRQRQGIRSAFNTARAAWNTHGRQNVPVPGGAVYGHPGAPVAYPVPPTPPQAPGAAPPVPPPGAQLAGPRGGILGLGERIGHVVRNLSREGFGFYGAWDVVKENWITKVVMSAGIGYVARESLKAVGVAGGPLGTIVGATTGGIWGYIRGKNQTETAATWMADLDILTASAEEINNYDEAHCERILGIINNAVEDGRMRGCPEQKVELAAKYRLVRNRLICLRNEAVNRGETLNPVMSRIDEALTSEGEVSEYIGRMAGKKYEEEYKELVGLKRKKVLMNMLKGAIISGTVGGLFAFVQEHGGIGGAIDWVKDKLHGIKIDITGGGHHEVSDQVGQALEAKKQLLEHSPGIQHDISTHHDNFNEILENKANLHDVNNTDIDLSEAGKHLGLTSDQLEAIKHYDAIQHLSQTGHDASVEGFKHSVHDLPNFDGLLRSGNLHEAIQMTNVHNLDLNTMLPNGEHFGQYLIDNKETFLQFPPDIQSFILSHPSVAPEFMNIATSGAEHTFKAIIDRYSVVMGAAALGGAGALYGIAHRSQKAIDQEVRAANMEGFRKANEEMRASGSSPTSRRAEANANQVAANANQANQERERQAQVEANREASIQELLGANSVEFIDPQDPRHNDLRGVNFHVDSVNRNNQNAAATFNLRPIGNLPRGRNIHDVNINEYIDNDGNLRRNRIRLRTQADQERERNAAQTEYERLVGLTIDGHFAGGLFVPDQASAQTYNIPQNMRQGIRLHGHTIWPTGLNLAVTFTDLHQRPVAHHPVYEARAEFPLPALGNYVYYEGYGAGRNQQKIDQLQQMELAPRSSNRLIYMNGNFYGIDSASANDVTLQPYDVATGNPRPNTVTMSKQVVGNSELFIFDQL